MIMILTRMKIERMKRGWSQQTLGSHAHIGAADVSKIENKRLSPGKEQAKRIGRALGLRPDELQEAATVTIEAVS
jgi:ribosome-binding protein aMBF1 (putative translation factor)